MLIMSDAHRYFLLAGKGRDNYTTLNKARWTIRDTWLCVGCVSPKKGTGAVDIPVQEAHPIVDDLGMIAGTDVGAGKFALFEQLGIDEVRAHLHLGRLLMNDGVTPFSGMCTYHGKYHIIVRGKGHATYRRCELCGRFAYFSTERDYLYPRPTQEVEIFDAGQGALVIIESLAKRVDLLRWNGIQLRELPVLERPLDGFDEVA
jgi:hypothetical protein